MNKKGIIIFSVLIMVFVTAACTAPDAKETAKEQTNEGVYCKNDKDYPECTAYMREYYEQLYNAFEPEKYFPKHSHLIMGYNYVIDKDGNISDLHSTIYLELIVPYMNRFFHPILKHTLEKYGEPLKNTEKK